MLDAPLLARAAAIVRDRRHVADRGDLEADRLQRTSVWLDNLEGGLDYLKQVVIEDKLGIAAELEADMARIVNTYECEWKKAVEDPQTLKRFRHFVNSDRTDDNVVFVQERGQIRPATQRRTRPAPAGDCMKHYSHLEQRLLVRRPAAGQRRCCPDRRRQIAIFRVGDAIYALDNYDPHSEANVLSRGLVGDLNGEPVVAPLFTNITSISRPAAAWKTQITRCARGRPE